MSRTTTVILIAVLGVGVWYSSNSRYSRQPPQLNSDWWGPEDLKIKQDKSIRPFKIKFDEVMVKDLKERLKNYKPSSPPLEGVGPTYGFNSDYINSWIQFWAEEYPFQKREDFLNQFPQYKTNIQGLDIHFVRVKPEVPQDMEVVPIILLHGWAESVREFYEAISLLTATSADRDFALEIIVPSLPGFGFSDAAVRPGLGAMEMAVVFKNLMKRLGYSKYYVQGCDWGAVIGATMATMYPEEVLGYHTNLGFSMHPKSFLYWALGSIYPPLVVQSSLQDRMYPLTNPLKFIISEAGYYHVQATKPDSIGVALSDSPAGLLAYMLQLMSVGTRAFYSHTYDGGLDNHYSREKIIDNLMYYWTTNSITTSCRIYAETTNLKTYGLGIHDIPTPVPTWVIQAKYEITYQSPFLLKFKFPNLVNTTVLETGGHFLALELPEVFSDDVLRAVAAFRNLHKISQNT